MTVAVHPVVTVEVPMSTVGAAGEVTDRVPRLETLGSDSQSHVHSWRPKEE